MSRTPGTRLILSFLLSVLALTACGGTTPVAGPSPSVSIGATEESPASRKEVWEGTWEDEHRNPAVVSRSDRNVILTVAPDGSVTGEGSATQTTEGGSADYYIKIRGTRDDDAFRLAWTGPGGTFHHGSHRGHHGDRQWAEGRRRDRLHLEDVGPLRELSGLLMR